MNNLSIRYATIDDCDVIFKIDSECDDCYSNELIKESLINSSNCTYLATLDSVPIGYISYSLVCDEAELIKVVVLKEYRNNGYGKSLIKKSIELLKEKNIKNIFLEVRENNNIAIKVYEYIGFDKINIRKKYYDGCIDAIIYRLSI